MNRIFKRIFCVLVTVAAVFTAVCATACGKKYAKDAPRFDGLSLSEKSLLQALPLQ